MDCGRDQLGTHRQRTPPGPQQPPQPHDEWIVSASGRVSFVPFAAPTSGSIVVSQARWPDPAAVDTVVIAASDEFADALPGTALSGAGPLLLVPPQDDGSWADVQHEIDRLVVVPRHVVDGAMK